MDNIVLLVLFFSVSGATVVNPEQIPIITVGRLSCLDLDSLQVTSALSKLHKLQSASPSMIKALGIRSFTILIYGEQVASGTKNKIDLKMYLWIAFICARQHPKV